MIVREEFVRLDGGMVVVFIVGGRCGGVVGGESDDGGVAGVEIFGF